MCEEMAKGNIEETVREDRISALPEDLLVTILSLVAIKDAVATMILSKRWRSVWMMLPILDFTENRDKKYFLYDDCDDDDDESTKKIWWFIDKSMELHKAPVLANLLIKLGPECPSDAGFRKWFKKAIDSGVVVLKFKLCWSTGPITLPNNLYTCETLEELTLSQKILVDFPSSSCLPSLMVLELFYVVYKDEASLVRFLRSCPVLEYLGVKRNKGDNVTKFVVNVPSLEYLRYDNLDHDTGRCLTVDTPALMYLQLSDYSRGPCSFGNMPLLEKAYIEVESFPDIEKSETFLSGVLSLELLMSDETLVRCSTFDLSCLIELIIWPHISDWLEQVQLLLKSAPKLKKLSVDNRFTEITTPLSWKQPSSIPACLSSNLKMFEYREYGNTKEEEKFLTYILAHSKHLKTATISLSPSSDPKEQAMIIEELRDIPRVSATSQILFR